MDDSELPRLETALGDRYRVTRRLGSGGMATVYLAEDVKHNRNVAIKVLVVTAAGPEFDRGYSEGRNLTLDEAVVPALDSIRQRATSRLSG